MPDELSRDLMRYRLERSADDLDAAKIMLAAHKYNAAANRAYYSVFHAMRSVLASDKKDFNKHSAVISFFTKDYIMTGCFDKEFNKTIRLAEMLRSGSDYTDYRDASFDEADEIVRRASDFYEAVESYILKRLNKE